MCQARVEWTYFSLNGVFAANAPGAPLNVAPADAHVRVATVATDEKLISRPSMLASAAGRVKAMDAA